MWLLRRCTSVLLIVLLLPACGVREVSSQKPAPSTAISTNALVLPDIPAYPSATTFSLQQRSAEQMSLDPARVVGDVQVVTIQTTDEPLDQFRVVADFYRQTLPSLGWTLAADLGPAMFYRRPSEVVSQERGLYVTVRAGMSRHEVEVELATFLAPAPISAPTQTLLHQATWKNIGNEPLTEAFGIVPSGSGTLFVSDVSNAQLLELNSDGSVRRAIKADGESKESAPETGERDTNNFLGLALDPRGRLLAIAKGGTQLLRFEPDGQTRILVNNLTGASGLAVAPNGTIYVSDSQHGGIRLFTSDGVEIALWDTKMPDDAQAYTSPSWIAVDRTGAVYITDSANHRIKKFDSTGRALIAWGSEGHSPGRFTNPHGIAIGSDGLIYVVDGNPNNRVQIFTSEGVLAGIWWPSANWWEHENHAQIYAANGIAIRADGQIAIADYGAGEIEFLTASGAAVTPVPLAPSNAAQSHQVTPSTTLRQVPTQRDWMAAASAWLSGSPCQAPCWEGITPGKTSVGEALDLLRQHPLIDPSSVAVLSARNVQGTDGFDPMNYPDVVAWNWVGMNGSGTYGGVAYFNRGGSPPADLRESSVVGARIEPDSAVLAQTIYAIRIDYRSFQVDPSATFAQPSLPFTLTDVEAAFGQPTSILARSEGLDWYTLSVVYPQQGAILLEYGRSAPLLADTWRPPVVIFSDQPLVDGRFGLESTLLTPWQGVQPFAFYCRDERGAPCQGAQSR